MATGTLSMVIQWTKMNHLYIISVICSNDNDDTVNRDTIKDVTTTVHS